MALKLDRIVSRTGPASEARYDAQAMKRAENEGWPVLKPPRHPVREAGGPLRRRSP